MIELLVVVGLTAVIAAIAIPMMANTLGNFRLSGDARGLSNGLSVAKMRAASDFTQTRLFIDLDDRTYHIEEYRRTGTPGWVSVTGSTNLSLSDTFGFGVVSTAPPNTQATIGQSAACLDGSGKAIGGSSCVVFNSRGIPVEASPDMKVPTGAPTGVDAVYVTDGTAVYGVTVSATGLIRLWRTGPKAAAAWVLQ
jgi:Tfp pilus assembly protein FimT